MRKPRPIGPLTSLTPEQKQQLCRWYEAMTYEQIAAQIALAPPDGFGLNVSVWQLRRYFQRLSLDSNPPPNLLPALGPDAPSDRPSLSTLVDQAALGENIFTPATLRLLEERSFALAAAGEDTRKISTIFGLLLKSRDTSIRERMLEIQKQKLALRTALADRQ